MDSSATWPLILFQPLRHRCDTLELQQFEC
jgi:hypothetical protein